MVKQHYEKTPAEFAVFANIKKGTNLEDTVHGGNKDIGYYAQFFRCHLSGSPDACLKIYGGKRDALCNNSVSYVECLTRKPY